MVMCVHILRRHSSIRNISLHASLAIEVGQESPAAALPPTSAVWLCLTEEQAQSSARLRLGFDANRGAASRSYVAVPVRRSLTALVGGGAAEVFGL